MCNIVVEKRVDSPSEHRKRILIHFKPVPLSSYSFPECTANAISYSKYVNQLISFESELPHDLMNFSTCNWKVSNQIQSPLEKELNGKKVLVKNTEDNERRDMHEI